MAAVWTPLDRQPRSLSEGELSNINEEHCSDEKDDSVPEEVIPENYFTLKKLLERFHDIERAKDKMLGADPDLERNITVLPRCRKDV